MAPSPIPAPLPPWAKALLIVTPYAVGFLRDLVTHVREEATVDPLEWRRVQVRISDTASANAADDIYCTFDLCNITAGSVDTSWTTTDYTTAEAQLDSFWTALKPKMPAIYQVDQYRWYRRRFTDVVEGKPAKDQKAFVDSGPPERVTAKTISGTAATRQAAQVACSLTEKTAWPYHWGRTYLPCQLPADLSGSGRLSSAAVDLICSSGSTMYAALAAAELFPVVPITSVARDPVRALLTVNQVQVDDVPDIVRRRRLRDVTYRKVLP